MSRRARPQSSLLGGGGISMSGLGSYGIAGVIDHQWPQSRQNADRSDHRRAPPTDHAYTGAVNTTAAITAAVVGRSGRLQDTLSSFASAAGQIGSARRHQGLDRPEFANANPDGSDDQRADRHGQSDECGAQRPAQQDLAAQSKLSSMWTYNASKATLDGELRNDTMRRKIVKTAPRRRPRRSAFTSLSACAHKDLTAPCSRDSHCSVLWRRLCRERLRAASPGESLRRRTVHHGHYHSAAFPEGRHRRCFSGPDRFISPSRQAGYSPVFTVALTVYVAYWGYEMIYGRAPLTAGAFMWRIVRIAVIYTLAFGWVGFLRRSSSTSSLKAPMASPRPFARRSAAPIAARRKIPFPRRSRPCSPMP